MDQLRIKNYRLLIIIVIAFFAVALNTRIVYAAGSNFNSASTIPLNSTVSEYIESRGDYDYYKFSTTENGYVDISFGSAIQYDSDNYWDIELYDSNDDLIDSIEAYGNKTIANFTPVGLPAGTYYLIVRAGTYVSNDPYTVTVNFTPSSVWEKEFNENTNNANEIALNTAYNGTILHRGDYDYYAIQIKRKDNYRVQINTSKQKDSNNYWKVYLYDDDGNSINSFYVYGNKSFQGTDIKLSPGKYYIAIKAGSYVSNSKYQILLANKPKTPKTIKVKSGKKKAVISWSKVASTKGYEVYRSNTLNGKYKKIKTFNGSGKLRYTNKKLKRGKTYYYKVRAYKLISGYKIYGSYSKAKKVTIK